MRHERHGLPRAASLFLALILAVLCATAALAQTKAASGPAASGVVAQGSASGQQSLVEARTEIHKERSLKSPVVAVLAPGERVQTGFLRDGFLAVFRLNDPAASEAAAVGYVPAGMVKAVLQAAAAQPTEVKAAPPVPVKAAAPAPVKTAAPSAPAPEMKAAVKDAPGAGQPMLNKEAPVRVTSDKMVYNQAENSVSFQGNVHGTHTDMAIWAERVTAYFADKKKGKDKGAGDFGDSIERIVAEGNVRLVANKNDGACAKLTYMVAEGVIRMEGNPILREGQNTIRGEVIKFHIRENRSEVLGGDKRRVEAVFFTPKGEEKK